MHRSGRPTGSKDGLHPPCSLTCALLQISAMEPKAGSQIMKKFCSVITVRACAAGMVASLCAGAAFAATIDGTVTSGVSVKPLCGAAEPAAIWPPPGDARPYADSPYAKQIDLALKFVTGDRSRDRWICLATLDFLQRKFGLPERYSIRTTFAPECQTNADLRHNMPMGRLVNPSHVYAPNLPPWKEDPMSYVEEFQYFMQQALYCDRLGLRTEFFPTLRRRLIACRGRGQMTEYIVTHLALSLQWTIENNCTNQCENFEELRTALGDALEDIVNRNGPRCDVSYESMSFLYYMGFKGRVSKEWVDAVAAAQRPDGGWLWGSSWVMRDESASDIHPTVLALWTLLEASLPEVSAVPWIQHPEREKRNNYEYENRHSTGCHAWFRLRRGSSVRQYQAAGQHESGFQSVGV